LSENPSAGEKRLERRQQEHLDQATPDLTFDDLRKRYEVDVAPFPAEVQK
jgi:hypothetical protein